MNSSPTIVKRRRRRKKEGRREEEGRKKGGGGGASINVINMHYRDLIYTFLAVVNRPWTNYCLYRHFTKEEDPPVSS